MVIVCMSSRQSLMRTQTNVSQQNSSKLSIPIREPTTFRLFFINFLTEPLAATSSEFIHSHVQRITTDHILVER